MPRLHNIPLILAVLGCLSGAIAESSILAYALIMLVPCAAAHYMSLPALRTWLVFTFAWIIVSTATLAHMRTTPASFWSFVSNERLAMAIILATAFAFVSLVASAWDVLAERRKRPLRAQQ